MKPKSKKNLAKKNASTFDLINLSQALSSCGDTAGAYDFSELSEALSACSAVERDDANSTVVTEILRSKKLIYQMRLRLEMKRRKSRKIDMLSAAITKNQRRKSPIQSLIERESDFKLNKRWRQLKLTDIFCVENRN